MHHEIDKADENYGHIVIYIEKGRKLHLDQNWDLIGRFYSKQTWQERFFSILDC